MRCGAKTRKLFYLRYNNHQCKILGEKNKSRRDMFKENLSPRMCDFLFRAKQQNH